MSAPQWISLLFFFVCKVKTKKKILFSLLFTTATKNKIITIFIPFSTSSSKCRITPRGCGFFSTNWGPPFTTAMGLVYRVHNYSSYYSLPSQHLDPALPTLLWFTPAFPTCPTLAQLFWDIKRTYPEEKVIRMWPISPLKQSVSLQHLLLTLIVPPSQVWFLRYVWPCLTSGHIGWSRFFLSIKTPSQRNCTSFFQSIRLSGCKWWLISIHMDLIYIVQWSTTWVDIYRKEGIQIRRITDLMIFYILGLPVPSSGLSSSSSIQTEWLYEITSILPHITGNVGDISILPLGNP